MANLKHIRGRNCSLKMDDVGGTSFTLTGDGNTFTLAYSATLLETSAYGDGTVTHMPDIKDYTVSFSGYANFSGSSACKLLALVGASVGSHFTVAPAGSAPQVGAASPSYSGSVHVESIDLDFPADGMVTYSFTLRPRRGNLTFTGVNWT